MREDQPDRDCTSGSLRMFCSAHSRGTKKLFERLKSERVIASLREGNIRVSTHLYNTEKDIDKLVEVIAK